MINEQRENEVKELTVVRDGVLEHVRFVSKPI